MRIPGCPRLRFAPSPTGLLHIGGARTALFCYLVARKYDGKFVLRIEDTDRERSREEFYLDIVDSLQWLGINWDEGVEVGGPYGPYRQSERMNSYRRAVERLLADGKAFCCTCPPDVESVSKYDFNCRHKAGKGTKFEEGSGLPVRIKCDVEEFEFEDAIHGKTLVKGDQVGDIIIIKSNGDPLYNFTATVDDIEMKISFVLRGDDHLSNTPKQLLIYKHLGESPPLFGHIPLIAGTDHRPLSKRHGDTSVTYYRRIGILPEALLNFIILIGWAPKDNREDYLLAEMVEAFQFDGVQKASGIFNLEKLFWFNGRYIRSLSPPELTELAKPFIHEEWLEGKGIQFVNEVTRLLQERMRKLEDYRTDGKFFFEEPEYDSEAMDKFLISNPKRAEIIQAALTYLRAKEVSVVLKEELEEDMRAISDGLGLKFKDFAQPIRVAVTGTSASPPLFDVLRLLGSETVTRRLERFS